MSSILIKDIKGLIGTHPPGTRVLKGRAMKFLPMLENSWLLLEDQKIKAFGSLENLPSELLHHPNAISAIGKYVFPAWCDSHTHLVFACFREEEFVMKVQGKSYAEIAANGGGILNSAKRLQALSEDELYESSRKRLEEVIRLGTGAIEIKSGYGLSVESELKMLRVIRRLKKTSPIPIKATFLAAHTYPLEFKEDHEGYLKLIIDEMLPLIHKEGLADYIDVFCETGFFSNSETSRILKAGAAYGLKPKIHANQLSASGAVETGVEHQAVSVDHLEMLDESAINALKSGSTLATILPGCSLYLGIPFADARSLINADIPVALASDYNPGSSPSGNMNLAVSLACMRSKMLPEEALNAATINGAAAMELSDSHGSIAFGKAANVFITKEMPSLAYFPYAFGSNLIETVIVNGEIY